MHVWKDFCKDAARMFFLSPRPHGRGRRDCGLKVKFIPNGIKAQAGKHVLR
jgi:hypothetical protein